MKMRFFLKSSPLLWNSHLWRQPYDLNCLILSIHVFPLKICKTWKRLVQLFLNSMLLAYKIQQKFRMNVPEWLETILIFVFNSNFIRFNSHDWLWFCHYFNFGTIRRGPPYSRSRKKSCSCHMQKKSNTKRLNTSGGSILKQPCKETAPG